MKNGKPKKNTKAPKGRWSLIVITICVYVCGLKNPEQIIRRKQKKIAWVESKKKFDDKEMNIVYF